MNMLRLMDMKAKTRLVESDKLLCRDRVSYAELKSEHIDHKMLCLVEHRLIYTAKVTFATKEGTSLDPKLAYKALFREIYGGLILELEDLLLLVKSYEIETAAKRIEYLLEDLNQG